MSICPTVRALEEWAQQKVKALAEELHKAMMAENKPREREQAKTVLKSIRDLMRQYLDPDAAGETEDDDQEGGKTGADQSGYRKKRKPSNFWGSN